MLVDNRGVGAGRVGERADLVNNRVGEWELFGLVNKRSGGRESGGCGQRGLGAEVEVDAWKRGNVEVEESQSSGQWKWRVTF